MRKKNTELMQNILEFINNEYSSNGIVPSMREIATYFGISKSCVSNYIADMKTNGMLETNGNWRGLRTKMMDKMQQNVEFVPIIGCIACGTPMFAEENIENYIPLPKEFLGKGSYYMLRANGESMINAGIEDGDMVLVKQQETAISGQIVVALINNETTLKRYLLDDEKQCIRLHPENDTMADLLFKNVEIQGIAVKVIKNLI